MANAVYNSFKRDILSSIDLDTDTIKVVLVTSSYSPDVANHTQYSHITDQVTGTGYTAGGATLSGKSVTKDDVNNKGVFDADDVTWPSSTIMARGAILYKYIDDDGSPDDTSPLICYFDFTENKVSSNTDFQILWNTEGILSQN